MPASWSSATPGPNGAALEVLTPPKHFAIVESGLYRSTMPSVGNFPFLKQLGLKHVIILSADSVARNVTIFFEENAISVSHTGAAPSGRRKNTWKPTWKPLEEEVVKASLEIILRADVNPLLICDTSGVQRVGVVIGCLRRLQWWNLNSIVNEYRSFAGTRTRYVHEQMIELFDTDLVVIPPNNPSWYSAQVEMQAADDERYADYVHQGRLSTSGMLSESASEGRKNALDRASGTGGSDDGTVRELKSGESCAYQVYYYSTESPLNSVTGALPPRIQRLQ
jgi:protein tyrosine/serine phosphatase